MPKVVCFDLEGPLSPQDNAYEVMGLFKNGHRIFETISRYDDLLALEGRENYEAGDTLMLIAPFLVYHTITEDDIKQVSKKAMLVDGARDLITHLKKNGFMPYIISTSYEQHAHNIGWQLGVDFENISCTKFPLDRYIMDLGEEDSEFLARAEEDILEMYPPINDMKVKMRLDKFFFSELPASPFGKIMDKMSVVGGARKVTAAKNIAELHGMGLKDLAVIGDSITDFKMLKAVHEAGGLAAAFNGNQYAIPYATVGCATTNMMDMYDILKTWMAGGRDAVISAYYDRRDITEPFIHVLEGMEDYSDVITIHKKVRKEVRGRAAKLG
jgi:energy-converting hydrogenase A subunit R